MAHFAEIDTGSSTVVRVLVVHNDVTDLDGVEDEQRGIDFLTDLFPDSATWVQTSYNRTIRHNYAGVGDTWDAASDAFYGPQPFPSWSLDEDYRWQAPTPMPDDSNDYNWDEDTTSWVEQVAE
jgi:hypothetical protein